MRSLLPMLTVCCLSAAPAAHATTYVVNPQGTGDLPTLRAAVSAVIDRDVIELTNGTFTGDGNRDVDLLGKHVTIRTVLPAQQSFDPAASRTTQLATAEVLT